MDQNYLNLNGFEPSVSSEEVPGEYQKTESNPPVSQIDSLANVYETITPEEVEQTKKTLVKVTHEDAQREELAKIVQAKQQEQDVLVELLDGAIKGEQERADLVSEDSDYQEMVVDAAKSSGSYVYAETVRSEPMARMVEDDEFVPDYMKDDDLQDDPSDNPPEESADDDLNSVMADIRKLPNVDHIAETPANIVSITRERKTRGEPVKSSRVKESGDLAFNNAIAKLKKSNFRTVQVPLVNSGFWADIVGTGGSDLMLLYSNVDRGIDAIDYELEKMKSTIRGVVATNPKVPMENLRNMIHYVDYNMMSFGRLCATFKEINSMGSCPECSGEFRYKANPADMLLNADELSEKINQLRSVKDISELSLLTTDRKFVFDSVGVTVIMGHPSYINMVTLYNALKHYSSPEAGLSQVEIRQFTRQINLLSMIRSLTLPTGERAANAYQIYQALRLLDPDELNDLRESAKEMTAQVVSPKFGVKDIICPHCGKKITLPVASVDDMVFYHSTVVQSLTQTTEKK